MKRSPAEWDRGIQYGYWGQASVRRAGAADRGPQLLRHPCQDFSHLAPWKTYLPSQGRARRAGSAGKAPLTLHCGSPGPLPNWSQLQAKRPRFRGGRALAGDAQAPSTGARDSAGARLRPPPRPRRRASPCPRLSGSKSHAGRVGAERCRRRSSPRPPGPRPPRRHTQPPRVHARVPMATRDPYVHVRVRHAAPRTLADAYTTLTLPSRGHAHTRSVTPLALIPGHAPSRTRRWG